MFDNCHAIWILPQKKQMDPSYNGKHPAFRPGVLLS